MKKIMMMLGLLTSMSVFSLETTTCTVKDGGFGTGGPDRVVIEWGIIKKNTGDSRYTFAETQEAHIQFLTGRAVQSLDVTFQNTGIPVHCGRICRDGYKDSKADLSSPWQELVIHEDFAESFSHTSQSMTGTLTILSNGARVPTVFHLTCIDSEN